MNLGLRRGTVQLASHDPAWKAVFEDAAAAIRLRTGLDAERVQHVGSTAVPGIAAKPILDIVVGADDSRPIDRIARALVGLGYIDRGQWESSTGRLLVRESAPEVRTIHVHIVLHGSRDWRDYVDFREALLASPELRLEYSELKARLAVDFANVRKRYTKAKEPFIRSVLRVAGRPRLGLAARDRHPAE